MKQADTLMLFSAKVEAEVQKIGYGTLTFNVIIKQGIPIMKSLNIVKQKRIRYNMGLDKSEVSVYKVDK